MSEDVEQIAEDTPLLVKMMHHLMSIESRLSDLEKKATSSSDIMEMIADEMSDAIGTIKRKKKVQEIIDENGDGYGRVDLGDDYWVLTRHKSSEITDIFLERPDGERVPIESATPAELARING